jgi:AAHS family benzoate transporter-like MFS transporter
LAGLATGPGVFGLLRFLAGLGLGGVAPIAISLVTEYTPKAIRSTMVAIMFCGIQIGCIGGAALGILIVPNYGWQQMFLLGFIPLLLVPVLISYLPDTVNFYLKKDKVKEIRKVLKKIDPDYVTQEDERYEMNTEKSSGFTVISLFAKKRAFTTIMFWITFFMSFWVVYGFGTWLPTIMQKAGYSIGSSLWFLVFSNLGAIIGAIFCGWLLDRLGGKKVLIVFYLMAFIFVCLLGLKVNFIILSFLVMLTGITTMGTQVAANAYVSQYYPVSMRSSGIGWALGIGKFGAVLGSTVGGVLMSMNLSLQINFFLFAVPAIFAAIAMALVQERNSYSSTLLTLDQKAGM